MNKEQAIANATKIKGWFPEHDMSTAWDLVMAHVPKGGLMVEVGSWKGRSSYIWAAACEEKGANLICIDSFIGLIPTDHEKFDLYHGSNGYYKEGNSGSIVGQIKENLKGFGHVKIWEGDSRELHKTIKDSSADLIFIDGDHDMPILGDDLDNYYPKVKKGGYFCGHDYEKGNNVAGGVDPRFPNVDLFSTIWGIRKSA